MEGMSKRSRKLVKVYRKAVEQRAAMENESIDKSGGIDIRKKDTSKKSEAKKSGSKKMNDKKGSGKKNDSKIKGGKSDSKQVDKQADKYGAKQDSKQGDRSDSKQTSIAKKQKTDSVGRKMQVTKKAATSVRDAGGTGAKVNALRGDAHQRLRARGADSKRGLESKKTIEQFQKEFPYMQNRELSWLEFNKRVLDQGADPTVPLFERLGFISIFWSNLQEFFMIRVGSLTDLSLIKKTIIDTKSGMTPTEQLDAVYARCHELYPYYEQCFKDVRSLLGENGIVNRTQKELNAEQLEFAEDYFTLNVMPFLSPQIINARHPFPHLENGALYIVVRLDEEASLSKDDKAVKAGKDGKDGKKKKATKNQGAQGVTLGLIPLPRQCKRIVQLPGDGLQFMLLEHMIEMFVPRVFSMYKVKHTNVICVTRNADLDATEGIEEQGEDYREHMKRIIKKRARLAPVRLESERELSQTVKPVLMQRLNLKSNQLFVTSVPLNMSYTFDLPSLVDEDTRAALTSEPFTPQWPACLDRDRSIIEQVSEREVLLSYPYESMDAFVQLLREAATDPDVISIKITLYRLAKQSHLAEALIAAADAGKEVTALFELRARFDESNNIEWSQRFDQAGCNVLYGFRDFKVHSKICCITRQTQSGLQHITQLGTGNYNEKTAKLYTDFSFITTDPRIGRDAVQFFRNMALENTSDDYSTLWVAPLQIKQNIMAGIDDQIRKHKEGLPTGIFFKTNSITDKDIIDKIVEASQAGVKCNLFVRGISCIVPGIKGYTDNVCVDSIVGRLLEHSRIYCFGPFDGDVSVYLSSADLMTRNMDKRIEIAWPVLDEGLRDQVIGYIGTCMADTAKLRDLLPTKEYTPLGFFADPANSTGVVELFDSQSFLMDEAQRKRLDAAEMAVSRVSSRAAIVREIDEVEVGVERLSDVLGEEVVEYETVSSAVIESRTSEDAEVADVEDAEDAVEVEGIEAADFDAVAGAVDAEGAAEDAGVAGATVTEDEESAAVEPVDASGDSEFEAVVVESDNTDSIESGNVDSSSTFTEIHAFEVGGTDSESGYVEVIETEPVRRETLPDFARSNGAEEPVVVNGFAQFLGVSEQAQVDQTAQTQEIPQTQIAQDAQNGQGAQEEPDAQDSSKKSEIIREPISELEKEILPRELPTLDGVPTYEVLGADQADKAFDTWNIPKFEEGNSVPMHVGESSYTDPNTKPTPLEIPEEKPSFFKKLFGR